MKDQIVADVRDYDNERLIGHFGFAGVPHVGEVVTCDAGSFEVRIVEHYAWKEETEVLLDVALVCLWVSPYRRPN
jgi:hypothetical protein